jgi:hypothetical protein
MYSLLLALFSLCTLVPQHVFAIKFSLPAARYPIPKCIWNAAHPDTLVIVTANVVNGQNQRVDIEIVDSSPQKNVYLSKRGIKAETRLAITTHGDGQVGVCLKNYMEGGESPREFLGRIMLSVCSRCGAGCCFQYGEHCGFGRGHWCRRCRL